MTPSDRRRLTHVSDAIARIERYTAAGRASLADEMTLDAVLRVLTVIGEALGSLSDETYRQLPSLPAHLPKGQRNILVHEYWRVDADIVWNTVEHDLPLLRSDIVALLPG